MRWSKPKPDTYLSSGIIDTCSATLQETLHAHPLQLTGKIIMETPPAALARGLDSERIGSVMKLLISLVSDGKKAKTRVLR